MANTLESIMRLTDEYTATMTKIVNSAQQGEKATKGAESSAKTLGQTINNIPISGVSGLIGKMTTLVSTVYLARKAYGLLKESIQTAAQQQVQKSTFQSLLGNAQVGNDLYNYIGAYAKKSALDRENIANAATSFLAYTRNINQLQQLLDLTQRLYMFNPEQGAEGAVFALKEVMAGQNMSLKRRYNMVGISDEVIQKNYEKGDIAANINYVSQMMDKFGATQGVVNANFKSLSVQAQLFKTNLMSAIGDQSSGAVQGLAGTILQLNADMEAGKFQPFFDVMSKGTSAVATGLAWVAQNANILAPIVAGATAAILIYNTAMGIAAAVTTITGVAMSAAVGNFIGVAVALGAVTAAAATANAVMSSTSAANTKASLTSTEYAKKYSEEQKKYGVPTTGLSGGASIPTTVNNKDPIKVSGSIEIEKENLKYMFDAATAKFFATFNATKVEPTLTIQHQEVTEKADVQEINQQLAAMLSEASGVTAGGNYA